MDKLERIAQALRSLDLSSGVKVEERVFVGDADTMARLRDLEGMIAGLLSRDVSTLYDKSIAHDGVFDEDINQSGRYFAYLRWELRGTTPEEKEANLTSALEDLVTQYGKDALLSRIPAIVKGRQVTEAMVLRPEADEFPAYYSKSRMAYAEKMAAEELPKAVLAQFRSEEERLLDSFGWTTVRVQDKEGEIVDICGDVYALSPEGMKATEGLRAIWAAFVAAGAEAFYDYEVRTDGEYLPDIDEALGRYYAYARASLKGQSSEEKRAKLLASLPEEAVKALGDEAALGLFRESIDGDQVTASLTIRPEADEFPSYFNQKKIDKANERLGKQIAINVQAEIIDAVERKLGEVEKYVLLD